MTPERHLVSVILGGLVAAGAILLVPRTTAAQVAVSPAIVHFDFSSTDDGSATRTLRVHNRSDSTVRVRLYQRDFRQLRDGTHRFSEAGSTRHACAPITRVLPSQLRIEPGERSSVRVRMNSVESTCWGVVFAEPVPRERSRVTVKKRVGVKIYGLPPGGSGPRGRIEDVSVSVEADSLTAQLTVTNTGRVPLRPRGRLELRDVDGTVIARREMLPFSVLPRSERRVTVRAPRVSSPGTYLAVPVLALEDGTLLGGQEPFTVGDEGRREPSPQE